jgi:hypothetical protein
MTHAGGTWNESPVRRGHGASEEKSDRQLSAGRMAKGD